MALQHDVPNLHFHNVSKNISTYPIQSFMTDKDIIVANTL